MDTDMVMMVAVDAVDFQPLDSDMAAVIQLEALASVLADLL
jgi:hypothetical protein